MPSYRNRDSALHRLPTRQPSEYDPVVKAGLTTQAHRRRPMMPTVRHPSVE
jgi:hypothetical protein